VTLACYGALEIVGVIIIIINVEINSHRGAHLLLRNELAASFTPTRLRNAMHGTGTSHMSNHNGISHNT